ncbi:MAG: alpha/beta hydrolase, partial [Spirochaetia bacterium]|nr:alpha/beta hydrolase [Spirochaetia bacterium]
HSGFTEDLHEVINHTGKRYRQLYLIGFSLGGNMVLKYLGEKKYSVPGKIKKAFVFSVPCDLMSSSRRMLHIRNYFYSKRFLVMLTGKIRAKKFLFSEHPKKEKCGRIKSITDFDNCYTAPMHGFSDASDYYKKSSSRQYLKNIKTPTEMICSLDDPFLTEDCFPFAEAMSNRNINLTMYEYGGHMGFVQKGKKQTWLEEFTVREIGSEINKSGKRANK